MFLHVVIHWPVATWNKFKNHCTVFSRILGCWGVGNMVLKKCVLEWFHGKKIQWFRKNVKNTEINTEFEGNKGPKETLDIFFRGIRWPWALSWTKRAGRRQITQQDILTHKPVHSKYNTKHREKNMEKTTNHQIRKKMANQTIFQILVNFHDFPWCSGYFIDIFNVFPLYKHPQFHGI